MVISAKTKIDKGLLNLITQRLEHGSKPAEIEGMLKRAGFSHEEIKEAVEFAVAHDTTAHQRKVAEYDFLPPLSKTGGRPLTAQDQGGQHVSYDEKMSQVVSAAIHHRGLFSGRLRRKDFIMGFLFFFGLAFVFLTIAVTWIQSLAPGFWNEIQLVIEKDVFGAWLIFIPFIFAPVTVMLLSLISRRLHNLELPGWIAIMYLLVFVTPFGKLTSFSLFAMHGVLMTLFIILMSKKGHPLPNKHGPHPRSEGSIFAKVFGRE